MHVHRSWLLVAMAVSSSGCSVFNRIDACESELQPETTLNRRSDGSQSIPGAAALVPLPNGQAWLGFFSADDAAGGGPSEVRAVIIGSNGMVLPGCENASDQDETWLRPMSGRSFAALAAAPPLGTNRDGLAAFAERPSSSSPAQLRGMFFRGSGCRGAEISAYSPFVIATAPAREAIFFPTVVALSQAAGNDFAVFWSELGHGTFGRIVRQNLGPEFPATPVGRMGEAVPLPIKGPLVVGLSAVEIDSDAIAIAWQEPHVTGTPAAGVFSAQAYLAFLDQRLNLIAGPVPVGGEHVLDGDTPGGTLISMAWDGEAIAIAWVQLDETMKRRVFISLADLQGRIVLNPSPVSDGGGVAEADQVITSLPKGGFAVAWRERQMQEEAMAAGRLKAVLLDRQGKRLFNNFACHAAEFEIGEGSGGDKRTPTLLARDDGGLLAAWTQEQGMTEDRSGKSVRGVLLRPTALFAKGRLPAVGHVASGAGPRFDPALVPSCTDRRRSAAIGEPCACALECPEGVPCRDEATLGEPGGICTPFCGTRDPAVCGENARCELPDNQNDSRCLQTCRTAADCPPGRACSKDCNQGVCPEVGTCYPLCTADSECRSGRCDPYRRTCLRANEPLSSGAGLYERCLRQEDCRSGICGSGRCLTFCKASNPTCPENGVCYAGAFDLGLCYPPCQNGRCPEGQVCKVGNYCHD